MTTLAWLALAVVAVLAALLLATWATARPRRERVPVALGDPFPRCRTCPHWPGQGLPCGINGQPQEATDGCERHPAARERAARLRRKETP